MPLRFDLAEFNERRSGKSHTCEACYDGNCKDCQGTCDCSKCHKGSDASVLDALESKTASGQCPQCGGPSTMLGQLGNRVHYRCRNCGMDHSSEYEDEQPGEFQDFEEQMGHDLLGPHRREPDEYEEIPSVGDNSNFHANVSPMRWAKVALGEASMPPEGPPAPQHETALPYNPAAIEGQVADMHGAAQYAYQRAVAQGAKPEEAMQVAQQKNSEMATRTQEGQNVEGVQIPVINSSFVSPDVVKRVSHLL